MQAEHDPTYLRKLKVYYTRHTIWSVDNIKNTSTWPYALRLKTFIETRESLPIWPKKQIGGEVTLFEP